MKLNEKAVVHSSFFSPQMPCGDCQEPGLGSLVELQRQRTGGHGHVL